MIPRTACTGVFVSTSNRRKDMEGTEETVLGTRKAVKLTHFRANRPRDRQQTGHRKTNVSHTDAVASFPSSSRGEKGIPLRFAANKITLAN